MKTLRETFIVSVHIFLCSMKLMILMLSVSLVHTIKQFHHNMLIFWNCLNQELHILQPMTMTHIEELEIMISFSDWMEMIY